MNSQSIPHETKVVRKYSKQEQEEFIALVEKAVLGDRVALYNLCEKLADSILYRTRYIIGNEMDAEDVSQTIMLRICENIQNLRESKAFRAWLGGIVLHETRRHFSKQSKHGNVLNIDDYIEELSEKRSHMLPDESVEKKSIRHAVMESVSHLPHRQREAVVLHYFDDMCITDVASVMRIPHQSVTRYLALARKKLMSELQQQQYIQSMQPASALPLGTVISDAFKAGAAEFVPSNSVWFKGVLTQCHRFILSGAATPDSFAAGAAAGAAAGTAAGTAAADASPFKMSFSMVVGVMTTMIVAGAVALGILINGAPHKASANQQAINQAAMEARIVFTGGENYRGTERVNPIRAELRAEETSGLLSVLQWWISEAGSEAILFEGQDGSLDINDALSLLKANGELGEYNLILRFEDELGYIYRLSSNFYINEVPVPLDDGQAGRE